MKALASQSHGTPDVGISVGPFRLETDGTLWHGPKIVHLPPKELAALRLLIKHAGHIVTPQQLRSELWGEVNVSADSLPKCLSSLRAKLEPEDFIHTVYKRGYRLSVEIDGRVTEPVNTLPRLAIMPFATGYAVPEHLGSSIAEETIARLTGLQRRVAAVLARDSVFALCEQGNTALQVGSKLKANLVLTGTLRAVASQFRLRAEMIQVEDGTQIWIEDMLVPQNRIAGLELELFERLLLRLGVEESDEVVSISASAEPEPRRESVEKMQRNQEAYEFFLRGHHEWQTMERHRMQDALQHLIKATELDPSLIPAQVDMVNVCAAQALYGFMAPSVAVNLIRSTPATAPRLPLRTEGILPALGWVSFHFDRDLQGAIAAFTHSAHLPHDVWTTHLRAMFALSRRRFDEAISLLSSAIEEDPYSPWLHARLAWAYHLAGEASQSVEQIRRTIHMFPHHEGSCFYGSLILAFNGAPEEAIRLAHELTHRYAYFDLGTAVHAYTLVCAGKTEEARIILERLQWLSRERFVLNSFTPAVHVALGDHDSALAELRISAETRCPWFFQMLADPRLQPLHGHPEFVKLQSILIAMEERADREQ
jgi:DNA-binding winged helix-turn-helix (wHTH) protein/tetratricopeptide (TPR) repeat protein